MGIKGFSLLLKHVKFQPLRYSLSYFQGSRIAIDMSILLYRFRYGCHDEDSPVHITRFLKKLLYFLQNNITPIFIFEGKPPDAKLPTLQKRKNKQKKLQEKIEILVKNGNNEEAKKLEKQCIVIKKTHSQDLITILQLLGIPFIKASGEAEALCATLSKKKLIDFTLTDDTDALLFGCSNIIKHTNENNVFDLLDTTSLLRHMNISFTQFREICILCGCDYSGTLPGIGPIKSLQYIKKHNTINNIISLGIVKTVPDNFDYKKASKLFNTLPSIPDFNKQILKQYRKKELVEFVMKKGVSVYFINYFIKEFEIIKKNNNSITTLYDYFKVCAPSNV